MSNSNNFWKNYEYLCQRKGVSVYKAASDCHIKGTSTISYWRRGSKPNAENLNALTEYFGVTASQLIYDDLTAIGQTESASRADDDALYYAIKKLSPQQKQVAMAFIAGLTANIDMPL